MHSEPVTACVVLNLKKSALWGLLAQIKRRQEFVAESFSVPTLSTYNMQTTVFHFSETFHCDIEIG